MEPLFKVEKITDLTAAVLNGKTELVTDAISRGADINTRQGDGKSPLNVASEKGFIDIVRILLDNNADIESRDNDGCTPLYNAVRGSVQQYVRVHDDVVELLIEHGADVNTQQNDGRSPLMVACFMGQSRTVDLLLKHGSQVNMCDNKGWTPLHYASCAGKNVTVRQLLDAGADVKLTTNENDSCLTMAACSGHTDVVRALVSAEAHINLQRNDGASELSLASHGGHIECVKLLVQYGADTETWDNGGATPLYLAAMRGHTEVVQFLIEQNADVNACGSDRESCQSAFKGNSAVVHARVSAGVNTNVHGKSPLNVASEQGFIDIVRILLDNNADIESRDNDGRTPLYNAVRGKHHDIVALLIECGADVNTQHYGNSLLVVACEKESLDIVKLLLEHGSQTDTHNKKGWTPLMHGVNVEAENYNGRRPIHCAVRKGHVKFVELLIQHGANVDTADVYGNRPLHDAVRHGLNVVELLVHSGAKVNVQNITGETPLHVAIQREQSEVVTFLLNAGADVGLTDVWHNTPLHYLTPRQLTYDEHQEHVVKETKKFQHLLIRNAVGMTALSYVTIHGAVDYVNKEQENSNTSSAAHETDLPSEQHADPRDVFSSSVISCLLKSQQMKTFSKTKVYCRKELVLKDCCGNTPLHHAVGVYGRTKMYGASTDVTKTVDFLVQRGADINAQNNEGLTPLHVARGKAAVEACLRHADDQSFTVTDKRGRNFCHLLFISRDVSELPTDKWRRILGSDAKYSTDDLNRTPLHYACMKKWSYKQSLLTEEFVQKFSDEHINKQDRFGRTALHYAAIVYSIQVMDLLKNKGADDTIQDIFEMTADKYEHVCLDYKIKVSDLQSLNTLCFVENNFDSISRCMQLCFSDRSYNLQSYKAQLRNHICELRACIIESESYVLSIYTWCRFDYSQVVFRHTAALKQDSSEQAELLASDSECVAQPTTMFTAIHNQVENAMQYLAKEISDKHKWFACEVFPVGSAREGTKIGYCVEFDFDFVLTYLSRRCKVCYSPESPPGFVLLKATTTEYNEDLFNSNGILNTRIVAFKFEVLVKQILSSLSFCEVTGFEFLGSDEEFSLLSGTKLTKVNTQITLKFTKPVNGCNVLHTISVDVVPALCINDWWPEDMRRKDLCQTGECLIVFTQPQKKHPWIGWTQPHGFISFARAESRRLRDCPHVMKAAFMVVKRMSKQFFSLHDFFSSHVIKMALFWCLDDENSSSSSSNYSEEVNEDELLRWVQNILRRLLCFAAQDYVPSYFMPKCHQTIWLKEEYLKQSHIDLYQHGLTTYTDLFSVNDVLLNDIKSRFISSHLMYWSVLSDDDELKLFVPSTINPLIENDVCTTLLLAD